MSADIFKFNTWAGSSRGLLARPILPNNVVCFRADIQSISYRVVDLDTLAEVSGMLVVNDVMFTTLQLPWKPDTTGYTFNWGAPGTLWPLPNKKYRIVLTFLLVPILFGGASFILVYEANTKDPAM